MLVESTSMVAYELQCTGFSEKITFLLALTANAITNLTNHTQQQNYGKCWKSF